MPKNDGHDGYIVNARECEAAGLKEDQVKGLAVRLARIGREAEDLGLTIFGGAGRGDLRRRESTDGLEGALIVAQILDGNWDGGDGANHLDENGLLRGES